MWHLCAGPSFGEFPWYLAVGRHVLRKSVHISFDVSDIFFAIVEGHYSEKAFAG